MFLCSYLSLNNFLSSILILDKKEIKIKGNRNKEIFVYLNLILFNCYFVNYRSTFDFNNFLITEIFVRNILIHNNVINDPFGFDEATYVN